MISSKRWVLCHLGSTSLPSFPSLYHKSDKSAINPIQSPFWWLKSPFSYGFPTFSYGFPMVFPTLWFSSFFRGTDRRPLSATHAINVPVWTGDVTWMTTGWGPVVFGTSGRWILVNISEISIVSICFYSFYSFYMFLYLSKCFYMFLYVSNWTWMEEILHHLGWLKAYK